MELLVAALDKTNFKGVYRLALTAAMVDTLGEFTIHVTSGTAAAWTGAVTSDGAATPVVGVDPA